MKQVIRKGLKDIIVDEVPDPGLLPHHVLVRPLYSLISSGTETASIHRDSLLSEVADNPAHLRKIWDVAMKTGPAATLAEVRAKFSEYAVLGYSGAGVVAARHATVTDLEIGERVAYGGEGTGHGETILVGRNLVARMPEGVAYEHACFATLGSIAMNAVRTARIELGDVVAVIGLGLVGQLVAQLVRLQGGVVVGIDLNAQARGPGARAGRRSWDRGRFGVGRRARADQRARSGLRDRGGSLEIAGARAARVAALPRPRPHLHRRRGGDGVPLERHVPEGNSALHVARLRSRQLRRVLRKAGARLSAAVRALDRESQHGGVPAAGRGRTRRRPPADHARISARRRGQGLRHDPRSGGGAAWRCCCAIRRHRRRTRWRPSRRCSKVATPRCGPRQGAHRIRAGRRGQPGQVGAPAESQEAAGRGSARGLFGGRRARQELRAALRRGVCLLGVRRGAEATRKSTPC